MKFKFILWVFFGVLMTHCSPVKKETTEKIPDKVQENNLKGGIDGMITAKYAKNGCGYLFVYTKNGENKMVRPHELPENYRIDGLMVNMKFHFSRMPQDECTLAMPVIIDGIQKR